MINTIQNLIDSRKVRLNLMSWSNTFEAFLKSSTKDYQKQSKDVEEAMQNNDETDRLVLEMFK